MPLTASGSLPRLFKTKLPLLKNFRQHLRPETLTRNLACGPKSSSFAVQRILSTGRLFFFLAAQPPVLPTAFPAENSAP